MLKIVFMGTAEFAVSSLRAITAAGHQVLSVVTQPDRPHGRGLRLQPSPVKAAAGSLNLPVLQPEKASQAAFVEQLRALHPDLIAVVAYGQILRPAVLELPPRGCVNVHASLLPELRGAAPIQWAIIRGFPETGVSTMLMDAGMDTGDVLLTAREPIAPQDTAGTLAERLAPLGANLLVRTLAEIESGQARRFPQESATATYAPMLRKEDGAIRWHEPAEAIRNRIHGCNPGPGAFARRGDVVLKIWRAAVTPGAASAAPGTVLTADPLVVAAGEGAVRLLEVQPESRSRLPDSAFVRGYRIQSGELWRNGV